MMVVMELNLGGHEHTSLSSWEMECCARSWIDMAGDFVVGLSV